MTMGRAKKFSPARRKSILGHRHNDGTFTYRYSYDDVLGMHGALVFLRHKLYQALAHPGDLIIVASRKGQEGPRGGLTARRGR